MSIKAVIFDLDGTITKPYFDFDEIRRQMGLPEDCLPVWESMEKMLPEARKRAEAILGYHEQKAVEDSSLNFGAEETLRQLNSAGINIGILTRNTKANAQAVCKKHGLKCDIVVGREDGPVKPDAFGVLFICRQFGVEPEECIVVGDYLFDLLCAKGAGAIGVLLANHSRAEEFCQYADFRIERIDQLMEIIKNLN